MHILYKRQGQMSFQSAYFYTQTISHFAHLLTNDHIKMIVINSIQFLVNNRYIELYAYVIMPNHIHLIWNMLKLNGKESPAASFTKYTAHQFKKHLLVYHPSLLNHYKSDKEDRDYQFWKRDPLAIPLSTERILIQKLNYIHDNPIQKKFNLCKYPEDYRWSSASFYATGVDEFKILKDFRG